MTEQQPPGSFSPELALFDPAAAEQGRGDNTSDVVLTEDVRPPVSSRRRARDGAYPGCVRCVLALAVAGVAVGIRLGFGASNDAATTSIPTRAAARAIPDFVWSRLSAPYRVESSAPAASFSREDDGDQLDHVDAYDSAARLVPLARLGARRERRATGSALVDASFDIA